LSILAQNGNAQSFSNLGTAAGTGTMMISAGINSVGNIRVSCALGSTGTVLWNIVYFSSAL
jgi:predicted O-methyltransferase YrrM